MGRVAVAAKMITPEQLAEATREYGRTVNEGRSFGQVLVDLGMLNQTQLSKLVQLQKQVLAKAKAKRGGAAPAEGPPTGAGPQRKQPVASPQVSRSVERPHGPVEPSGLEVGLDSDAAAAESHAGEVFELEHTAIVEHAGAPGGWAGSDAPIPPGAREEVRPTIDPALLALMQAAVQAGASDVHVHAGSKPRLRIRSVFSEHGEEPVAPEQSERMAFSLLTDEERATFESTGEIDFSYTLPGVGRYRTNVYRQLHGTDTVMRFIPNKAPTLQDLGLPQTLARLTTYHQGMVLITGPTSCGKSSTMAALVNLINEERKQHILTIEDPIEYLHPSKRCLVNQRNVHRHTESFARALRAALREDPDVIVIGELRDRETVSLAMTAAETGHFVLATLHTDNAVRTVNRILGSFPPDQQEQVRAMLSESLKAVISQRLLPKADGSSQVPALEIMMVNRAVANLIRDQKTVQIRSLLQTGQTQGMALLDNSLAELVKAGTVTREEALRHAEDPKLIPG